METFGVMVVQHVGASSQGQDQAMHFKFIFLTRNIGKIIFLTRNIGKIIFLTRNIGKIIVLTRNIGKM